MISKRTFLVLCSLLLCCSFQNSFSQDVVLKSERQSTLRDHALTKLKIVLDASGHKLIDGKATDASIELVLINTVEETELLKKHRLTPEKLDSEGYQILWKKNALFILGGDEKGLMYGILDFRDQLSFGIELDDVAAKTENARFHFRAIKFNLPWSSYRQSESLQLHMNTVKDTLFWGDFMDMMVDNRFNALTLWNLHPFTFMIQPKAFPEATQFTGQEFEDWRLFYKTLFRMAKDRGIETYILNWNIITSPQMTEAYDVANYGDDLEWHYGFTPADTSQVIVDYMRESITQVINEYPNLTGVGVSMGERMKMPIDDAMQWVKNTFVAGIQNADRPAKFIHRAPFSIDPEVAREYIESYDFPDPILMEFKFNWSHGHSTPNLSITHGGNISDQYWNPKPKNYEMAWMMRNEDFIMLNWGQSDFIREHIKTNGQDFVAGYFVGSETYIPAKEFRMKEGLAYDWKYAFEKQWEFYTMWGRLLYNPDLPDRFFIQQFDKRYGKNIGGKMFEALKLGSEMPLKLASFYKGTWDFTLYGEGFLNGAQLYRNYKESTKAFINVEEMIDHPTLDARYLSISDYTDLKLKKDVIADSRITPLALADTMEKTGKRALQLCAQINALNTKNKTNFQIELNDIKTWGYLSLYFAEKLRGGTALDEARKTANTPAQAKAVAHLTKALTYWDDVIAITSKQYRDVSLLHIKTTQFSWAYFRPQVAKDIEIAQEKLIKRN